MLGRLHQQIADRTADLALTLAQCARVLAPGGLLVLTDLFSAWLAPTLTGSRSHKARTKSRAARLLTTAGFRGIQWHHIDAVIIRAVTART
jgi:hypothetical protein